MLQKEIQYEEKMVEEIRRDSSESSQETLPDKQDPLGQPAIENETMNAMMEVTAAMEQINKKGVRASLRSWRIEASTPWPRTGTRPP